MKIHYDKFVDLDVLVADDDMLSLASCCTMLNDLGMKAEGVSTGVQALENVIIHHEQKKDYFACIIDWKMPDMDGITTTREIRKAVGSDVPIIIISAYDWSDIEQEARAAGANAFISKPLFRSRLIKTFNSLVGAEEPKETGIPLGEFSDMNLTGYRALLVEDNELNAEIAAEILKSTGMAVDYASDGTEAANAFAEDVQAAKTVGMNEHISKPLDLKMLARTLDKWLKQ